MSREISLLLSKAFLLLRLAFSFNSIACITKRQKERENKRKEEPSQNVV